jgi:hypothetical protein
LSISSTRPQGKPAHGPIANPFASRKGRGRKREARRWRDVLAVRCATGPRSLTPLTLPESTRLWDRAFADLEQHDPALSAAVHECMWDDMVKEVGMTMEEWRRKARKRGLHLDKVRAELTRDPASRK